jgi:hypothetical protein
MLLDIARSQATWCCGPTDGEILAEQTLARSCDVHCCISHVAQIDLLCLAWAMLLLFVCCCLDIIKLCHWHIAVLPTLMVLGMSTQHIDHILPDCCSLPNASYVE